MMHTIEAYATGGQTELELISQDFANEIAQPAGIINPRKPWDLNKDRQWPIQAEFCHGWEEIGKNVLIEKLENILLTSDEYRIEYHLCYHDEPDKDIPCVVEQDDIFTS